jgi:hypothetical protein
MSLALDDERDRQRLVQRRTEREYAVPPQQHGARVAERPDCRDGQGGASGACRRGGPHGSDRVVVRVLERGLERCSEVAPRGGVHAVRVDERAGVRPRGVHAQMQRQLA